MICMCVVEAEIDGEKEIVTTETEGEREREIGETGEKGEREPKGDGGKAISIEMQ